MRACRAYSGFDMEHAAQLFKVCGVALLAAISLNLLPRAGGIALTLRIGGGALIFGVTILLLRDNVTALEGVISLSGEGESIVSEVFSLMLKVLGVALVSRFCADICRDCGENTLACGVESVGRIVMVSMTLPMVLEILDGAARLMDVSS